ncbi:Bax inhibitor-1/YccA family protein [uncultured Cytophaga sp.]|uniref:Bax inhibitor-1/YccA family protein n=1 Tax=uncultured Cytophaga sp. TaxID=160238 RepID=UPI00260A18A4|nr:Bax inhibitor-1/YccA family protein [uncultured Cytophaga sp.]
MRTSNPALNDSTFDTYALAGEEKMTIQGTVNKSFILIALVFSTALLSWDFMSNLEGGIIYVVAAAIIALILGLATSFKPTWSPYTAPAYALFEGVFLGAISGFMDKMYPGIAIQAVLLTCGTFLCLLLAYRSGLIKATENFKLGIVAATGAIFLIYMVTFVLGFFGISVPYIHGNGIFSIIFSLVVVVVAALNLVLDFDFIEKGEANGAPKYMEWYASFGLLVTLVWLYIEILKLLAKLSSRK